MGCIPPAHHVVGVAVGSKSTLEPDRERCQQGSSGWLPPMASEKLRMAGLIESLTGEPRLASAASGGQ